MHDSPLCKHLPHDGLSPEHYQREMSALLVTMISSSLLKGDHLGFSLATLMAGRASHVTFARIVVRGFVGVWICHHA